MKIRKFKIRKGLRLIYFASIAIHVLTTWIHHAMAASWVPYQYSRHVLLGGDSDRTLPLAEFKPSKLSDPEYGALPPNHGYIKCKLQIILTWQKNPHLKKIRIQKWR